MVQRVEFANTLRGLAAVSVMLFHFCMVFWTYPETVASLINAPVYDLPQDFPDTGVLGLLGPFGVALFFLISGFVIPFSLQKSSWVRFLGNRLLRIMPVYVVGLSITLSAIWASGCYFGQAWPLSFSQIWPHYLPGLHDLLGGPAIDGIIWTLNIEIRFYLICTLGIVLFQRRNAWALALPVLVFATALVLWDALQRNVGWFDQNTVVWYRIGVQLVLTAQFIVYMFIGTALHLAYCRWISVRRAAFAVLTLLAMAFVLLIAGPDKAGLALAPAYLAALAVFLIAYRFPGIFRANRLVNFFADISYPLYVIHGVSGYAVMRFMLEQGAHPVLAVLVASALAIFVAWLVHLAIERPSHTLAKALGVKQSASLAVSA